MSGQELYEFYLALRKHYECYRLSWNNLTVNEQHVWDDIAQLLAPEMSDEAKEFMGASK